MANVHPEAKILFYMTSGYNDLILLDCTQVFKKNYEKDGPYKLLQIQFFASLFICI